MITPVAIDWLRLIKIAVLLMAIAIFPTAAQLAHGGFTPPAKIPYGITVEEISSQRESIVWVDARQEDSYETDHIPGALNLNQNNWDHALSHLFESYQPGKTVIVYCSSGCAASEEIAAKIRDLGIEPVLVLEGGYEAWQKYAPHT